MEFDPNRTSAPMTSGQAPQTIAAPGAMSSAMCQADELRAAEDALRRQSLNTELADLASQGIINSVAGAEAHRAHLDQRGAAGLVSDYFADLIPPHPGAWDQARRTLEHAASLLAGGDLKAGHHYLVAGYAALEAAHQAWRQYLGQTIAGAESASKTLTIIRDGAMAIEVGLLGGVVGYAAMSGGAAGAATGALSGAAAATGTAAILPATQESTRGALQQIASDGAIETLRLAIHGVVGIAVGLGGSVAAIFSGLATLFTDPLKFVDDLMALPSVAQQIWANRTVLFAQLAALPPEEQAQAIGELVGHLEGAIASTAAMESWAQVLADLKTLGPPLLPMAAPVGLGPMRAAFEGLQADAQGLHAMSKIDDVAGAAGLVSSIAERVRKIVAAMPPALKANAQCKQFATELAHRLRKAGIKFERMEIRRSTRGGMNDSFRDGRIYTQSGRSVSVTGEHDGIRVGDMVFDNLHPEGMAWSRWKNEFIPWSPSTLNGKTLKTEMELSQ